MGDTHAALTRMLAPALPRSPPHFSDGTACVWRCCLSPWPMREASALRKTRNQFTGRRSTSVIHLLLLSFAEVVFNYFRVVFSHFSSRLQQACPRGTPQGCIPCGDHLEPRGSPP